MEPIKSYLFIEMLITLLPKLSIFFSVMIVFSETVGMRKILGENFFSCRFKNIVFKRNGKFEEYLKGYMGQILWDLEFSESDFGEFDEVILSYKGIFINALYG